VVEAPPLEADDVLLRDRLVAGGDERRQLVADAERRLLLLDPLDRIALEDELPVGRRLEGTRRALAGCGRHRFRSKSRFLK